MPTKFEWLVYAAVGEIPPGRVATYSQVARRVGCGSARAVGQALKRNPFAPRIPCHRVIASDFGIGGFAGATRGAEVRRKLKLLEREGVFFHNGRLTDASCVYEFL